MNIETNPTAHDKFQAAIKAKSWPAALETLAAYGVTARPSQAPKLRDAVRAEPSLVAPGQFVATENGAKREIRATQIFEPDRDAHGGITADWLKDPVRLEDTVPHFTTNWRATYQIHHHVAFGDVGQAVAVLRTLGLSCRIDDYEGALFQHITKHVHPRNIQRDGGTIVVTASN